MVISREMVGQKLGRYQIQKMIGAGGMGEVYLALDTMLNRTVALKILPRELESRDRVVKRFVREAQATARIAHPNIATLYGIEEHDGRYVILMEYIDGEPLSKLLRKDRLKIKSVIHYGLQIADALREAHEKGVLHRDIKPGNILITRKQQVKVLDFGLAKFIDIDTGSLSGPLDRTHEDGLPVESVGEDLTREGMLVGTPRYMAPEQILGKKVDVRSDIFAFGILLYEMIAAQHPFKVANNRELVKAITSQDPPPLKDFNPEAPDELIAVVMKALQKDPEARYQSAREMGADLEQLLDRLEDEGYFETSGDGGRSEAPSQRSKPPATPVAEIKQATNAAEPEPTIDEAADPQTQPGSQAKRPTWLIAAAAALVLIAFSLGALFLYQRSAGNAAGVATNSERPLIAVMYFDNFTNDPQLDWLGSGLTEMFTTDLAQVRSIEVVSKQRLLDTLNLLGKKETKQIDRNTASEVALKVGAEVVLSGSVLKINNKLRLNVRLEQLQSGKVIISDAVEGASIDEIFSLVDSVTAKINRHYSPANSAVEDPKLTQVTTPSVEAFRLYARGLERCWLTNFDEGLDDLERAVETDDKFAMAYLQIGNAKSVRNDLTGARAAIDKAVQNIDRAGYREQLLIKGVSAYFNAYDTGDYAPALQIFVQMEGNYPNDKEVHLWKGLTHWRSGDFKKAVTSYQKILDLDPDFNEMYISLAQAYADDEDYIAAIAALRKSLALHPGQPEARNLLGNIYTRMGRYDEALDEYRTLIEAKESYFGYRPYLNLAQLYFIKNESDKGREALEKYLKLTDDNTGRAWAYLVMYKLAIGSGRAREAEKHLAAALAVTQKTNDLRIKTIVLCYQSDFLLFMNRAAEAVKTARGALESAGIDIGGREASEQLALALLEQEGERAAIESIEERYKKLSYVNQKDLADVRRVIDGQAAFKAGNYERSLELWRQPLKYNIRLYWKTGLAAFSKGDYNEALTQFQKLLAREGFDPERRGVYWSYQNPEYGMTLARYYMGRIYEAKKMRDEAKSSYEKFLADWGSADFERPEIAEAKSRLDALK